MSRIVFPKNLTEQVALLNRIKLKHDSDGIASPLLPFFSQQNISLADDLAALTAAFNHEKTRNELKRQAETLCESRDVKFAQAPRMLRSSAQLLKALYRHQPRTLGDWGFTVNNDSRIIIPTSFTARLALLKAVKAKADSYAPAPSPLGGFLAENNIDLPALLASANSAEAIHNEFLQTAKDAESETEKRNVLWKPVEEHLRKIASYLKQIFRNNPKKLGNWGFMVDDSPRKPRKITSKVLPASKVIVNSVARGGNFINTGNVELILYKGKAFKREPVTVQPNEKLVMGKGCSRLIIMNQSSEVAGKFVAERSK